MPTIYEALGAEYAHLLRTLNLLEHTSVTRPDERERLLAVLAADLDTKRRIEEELLYPLLGGLPETREAAAMRRREATEVMERFAALRGRNHADPRDKFGIEAFSSLLRQHLAEMEYDLFELASHAVPDEDAVSLGERAAVMRHEREARIPRA
jgi:hypothetical protein